MKTKHILLSVVLIGVINYFSYAQNYQVRLGFLGNSITIGSGLGKPTEECYPSQLAELLSQKYGDTCRVENFAVSGKTLLKNGDEPLCNTAFFENGWNYAPDICFICLGTNDSKPQNWDVYGDEFLGDYLAMIDTFKLRNPNTKFIVAYPPPAYDVVWGIRDSVIYNGVIPIVDSVISLREATLVDFYHPLVDSVYLFPDKIHPNAAGAKVLAKIAFDRIVESDIIHQAVTDGTFVSSLETNKLEIGKKDTAILSWETVNANQVFLNGQAVEKNGSLSISPDQTTTYTLLALGLNGRDSLVLVQNVYQSELTLLSIEPYRVSISESESVELALFYYDQKGYQMTDTVFNIDWSIIEGEGSLINETDTSVTYVAGSAGKAKVQAAYGDISFKANITIEAVNAVEVSALEPLIVYPNPCDNWFYVKANSLQSDLVTIHVFDVLGGLKVHKQVKVNLIENSPLGVNVKDLESGIYFYSIHSFNQYLTGKILKK